MLHFRRLDMANGGAENIIKLQNLPADYDKHVLRCMFEHKGFGEAILSFASTTIEDKSTTAFVKLVSSEAAEGLCMCFNGFEAWSQIAHTVVSAT
eukprot:2415406-Karenia_brevis.AAC.1